MTGPAVMAAAAVAAVAGIVVIVHRLRVLDDPVSRGDAESIRGYRAVRDALAGTVNPSDDSGGEAWLAE